MKPFIPLSLFLILAGGLVMAQQIDLENEEPPPEAEQNTEQPLADEADEAEPPADADGTDDAADDTEEHPQDEGTEEAAFVDEALADGEPDEWGNGETEEWVDELADEETAEEESDSEEVRPGDMEALEDALAENVVDVLEEQPTPPQPGLAVRVERVHGGHTALDPAAVKLHAPFPAKLLAQVPAGWNIEKSSHAPAFTRDVELAPGSSITLSVQPHVLIPDADGASVFAVDEPGYAADLGYRQDATVGAILATSIRQLEEDSRQLSTAIDQLQQLLVSLPQPETALQETPDP